MVLSMMKGWILNPNICTGTQSLMQVFNQNSMQRRGSNKREQDSAESDWYFSPDIHLIYHPFQYSNFVIGTMFVCHKCIMHLTLYWPLSLGASDHEMHRQLTLRPGALGFF